MTKAALVDQVATTVDLSKAQTEAVLTPCLQARASVELRGFGRVQLRHRAARAGRHPRTGETLPIPAKTVPTFTAGKAFHERGQPSAAATGGAG